MKIPSLSIIAITLFCSLGIALGSSSASADCYTAGTPAEAKECRKAFLSLADSSLNENYSALIKVKSDEYNYLRREQRDWLKERDRSCGLAPGETGNADWTTAIVSDTNKSECVIEKTMARSQFLGFLREQRGDTPSQLHRLSDGIMFAQELIANDKLNDYLARLRSHFDGWDSDKDGTLSGAELAANSRCCAEIYWGKGIGPDHPLTWETVAGRASDHFRLIDKNHDGTFSKIEADLTEELQITLELGGYAEGEGPECQYPQPTPDAEIALLSAYETLALSSVGTPDGEMRAGLIRISPGTRPLYVVLSTFRPTIWTFEGDVSRIQHVALTTGNGVVGLKRSQVSFASCRSVFLKHPSRESILRIHAIRHKLGRLPDVIGFSYGVAGFSLPEGSVIQPGKKPDPLGWRNLRTQVDLFYPGGIVPINPDQVVSDKKMQTYDVLPGPAGLRQLVERGALIPLEEKTYRVTRKLTLPAGLDGANLAKFIVPIGVPAPEGDPGHSCIISESGKILAGICE